MLRAAFVALALTTAPQGVPERRAEAGFSVPTSHCLGVYGSPPGGSADKPVTVAQYRGEAPLQYGVRAK